MIKVQNHYFGRKALALATSGALIVTMVAPFGTMPQAQAESMDADGYVTAAATRAAQTAPEILGLSGVEETNVQSTRGVLKWTQMKYYIFGTGGDEGYNESPNPYMVNAVAQVSGEDPSATPSIVLNTARAGGGRGPMGMLGKYGSDETDDEVWNLEPDVVIGTGTKQGAVDLSKDTEDYIGSDLYNSGYRPKGVAYYSGENANIIKEMYAIAKAADDTVAESNGKKKLRYGNATQIAKNYEEYVRGTQGLVLKAIANKKVEKKTIALVNAYNSDSKTYTLTKPNTTLTGAAAGTSDVDHYLDMTNAVTDNLANKLGKTTVTADELAKADVILVGGNSVDSAGVASTIPENLMSKTYYTSGDNVGAVYDVMHNAVDNVQNAGRILGFVYPELIDQDDWICYYYDHFYHVKSDKLAEAIDNAMDGVRNQDAKDAANYLQWDISDASTYKSDEVQKKLDEGFAYVSNEEVNVAQKAVDELSKKADPTQDDVNAVKTIYEVLPQSKKEDHSVSNYTDVVNNAQSSVDNKKAAAPVIQQVNNLKANKNPTQDDIDKVTEAYNKLTDGQKALVTDYDSVIKAAQAKVDAANKKQAANTIKAAKSKAAVKVGKSTTVKISNAKGNVSAKTSNKKVATVKYQSGKITIKGVKAGKAKVTVTAAGNSDFKAGSKTITVTVSKNGNTLKVSKAKATVKRGKTVKVSVKNAKGKVTVKSSNKKVAKASYKKGKVVIKGSKKGKATVKVTAAGNGTYSKATKTIKVTVKK